MSLLIPIAVAFGVALVAAGGVSDDRDPGPEVADADLPPAFVAEADEPIEPAAGPEPLAAGVSIRSVDGAAVEEPTVDVSLLRYLANRGDRAAVEAEIERLRQLHPGWEPPDDLFGQPRPVVDVTPLWQLYREHDYAGVREEIARLRALDPEWQPPANLLALMAANEARSTMEQAAAAGDWDKVIETALASPEQIACGSVDNMWRLAEAQVRTGDREAAAETYADIVRDCDDADHRFATLQKAKDLLGEKALAALLPLETARPKSAAQERRIDTLRPRPKQVVATQPRELTELYADDAGLDAARAAMETARARKDAAAARKIGWVLYDARLHDEAAEWFELALSWKGGAEAAKGLATARAAQGDLAGLDQLQERWPEIVTPMLSDARGAALAAAIERADWKAILQQTRAADTTELMLPRAWALTELRRPTEALLSFQQVLHTGEATPAQRDEGAYGLVRSYLALGLYRDAEQAMERYGVKPDKVFEVRAELLAKAASEAFAREDYRRTLLLLEQRRAIAQPSRALLLQEAWARYHTNDVHTAKRIFASEHRLLATKETAAGLSAVDSRLYPN
jgi:hypothetical protein